LRASSPPAFEGVEDWREAVALTLVVCVGQYLVAIAERQEVGYINNAAIYKMAKALVVTIPRQCEYWSEEEVRCLRIAFPFLCFVLIAVFVLNVQRRQEREYLKILNNFLDQSEFYFCFDYDITRRVQHITRMTAEEKSQPLWQRVDERFFWNKHISRSFIEANVRCRLLCHIA
jgi:hypothetical protein